MASRVQFKFKSAVTSETVLFDGTYISVGDLKREIVDKKGLSKDHAAELLLSEAQTGRGTRTGEAHLLAAHLGLPPAAAAAVTPTPCRSLVTWCRVLLSPARPAEWTDDSELIQKNTSVIVRRVPGQKAKTLQAPAEKAPG